MLTQAHNQSNEIKQMTNEYVERVLTKSEETLLTNLQELKGAHAAIQKVQNNKRQPIGCLLLFLILCLFRINYIEIFILFSI